MVLEHFGYTLDTYQTSIYNKILDILTILCNSKLSFYLEKLQYYRIIHAFHRKYERIAIAISFS